MKSLLVLILGLIILATARQDLEESKKDSHYKKWKTMKEQNVGSRRGDSATTRMKNKMEQLEKEALRFRAAKDQCSDTKSDAGGKPNVLYIMADDLGYHDIGYEDSEVLTPNLDA